MGRPTKIQQNSWNSDFKVTSCEKWWCPSLRSVMSLSVDGFRQMLTPWSRYAPNIMKQNGVEAFPGLPDTRAEEGVPDSCPLAYRAQRTWRYPETKHKLWSIWGVSAIQAIMGSYSHLTWRKRDSDDDRCALSFHFDVVFGVQKVVLCSKIWRNIWYHHVSWVSDKVHVSYGIILTVDDHMVSCLMDFWMAIQFHVSTRIFRGNAQPRGGPAGGAGRHGQGGQGQHHQAAQRQRFPASAEGPAGRPFLNVGWLKKGWKPTGTETF